MDEKEYEFLSVKFCVFTKKVKVRLLETSYEYKRSKVKTEEPYELAIVKKKVKKVLRASAEALEGLPMHEDGILRKYCEQIVECVGEKRYPIWYKKLLIEKERDMVLEELSAEKARINARYDIEGQPHRDEAKCVSAALLAAYADAKTAEAELESARSLYSIFDKKSKGTYAVLLRWKYTNTKRTALCDLVDSAVERAEKAKKSVLTLEAQLCLSASKISECESRRAIEIGRLSAREEELARDYFKKVSMLN